jgi:hypothetical protein
MSVTLTNLSRNSADFYVGDRWAVEITGAASGQTVSVVRLGIERTYGLTDANGYFRMIGTMGREDIGLWIEVWKVGGVDVPPTIQFRVRPAPIGPNEAPFEIPESSWVWGNSDAPMPADIFISDDATVMAAPMDITLGTIEPGGEADPWNTCSTSVGSMIQARRRVYAY